MLRFAPNAVEQERQVTRVFSTLIIFIADVLDGEIAMANLTAIGLQDGFDAFMYPFVNGSVEPDARVVAKQAKLRIGGPVDPRMEAHGPGDFRLVRQRIAQLCGIADDETLVGIDIEDPFAGCLIERKIARGGKIVTPIEAIKRDRKAARSFDGVVARPGINQHDLVDAVGERFKAFFDEPRLVPNDQRGGQPAHFRPSSPRSQTIFRPIDNYPATMSQRAR